MDTIPSPLTPSDTPPIRTAEDLHQHWRRLMGPLGFAGRSLWIAIIDSDDCILPTLPQLDDLPATPPAQTLTHFLSALASALDGGQAGWSAALLLTRPGAASVTASDMAYLDVLTTAAAQAGLTLRPTFVATPAAIHRLDLPMAA